MIQFFLLFFLTIHLYLASNTIAVTENEPSSIVEGVSVITGDFYLQEEDVIVAGAEPLRLRRSYISQRGGGFFAFQPHQSAYANSTTKILTLPEPNGSLLVYQGEWNVKKKEYTWTLKNSDDDSKGQTNTARGKISAKSNLKNQTVHISSDWKRLTVRCPDGTKRRYHNGSKTSPKGFSQSGWHSIEPHVPEYPSTPRDPDETPLKYMSTDRIYNYLLDEEELPNGHRIIYEWPKKEKDVWQIKTCSHSGNTTYAWARFYPKIYKKDRSHGDFGVETSDGRHFEYRYFDYNGGYQLKEVSSDERPKEMIDYLPVKDRRVVNTITWPSGRVSRLKYYKNKRKPEFMHVKEVISQVKDNGDPIATHHFFYDIPNRKTTVKDPYGVPTIYSWDDSLRLTQIDRFKTPTELYNQVKFIWGKKGSPDESNLLCKILFDDHEVPIQSSRYFYDSFGNVKEERLYGNLTGKGSLLILDDNGFPLESGECYAAYSEYSKDGRNLLLSKKENNGCHIEYTYLPHSPLVTTETHYDRGKGKRRKRYEYNRNNLLIKEITEDIQKNTSLVTDFTLYERQNNRYPGLPREIKQYSLDERGLRAPLKKIILHYGNGGRVEKKEVFDETETFQYALFYRYQEGCLIEETNALGQIAKSRYDSLHNKTHYTGFGESVKVIVDYDLANRVMSVSEKGTSSSRRQTYSYDYRNHKSKTVDEYGNITTYEHDPFGHLLKTHTPEGGIISSSYSATGCEISHIDALGHETLSLYNTYNKPISITHPDGTKEFFTYNLDGTLEVYTDQNGMQTQYTYDSFKRVLSKKTPLSFESFFYDAFNLIGQTDPEGHLTTFEYDAAGRKIAEKFGEELTTKEYDTFGRPYKVTSGELTAITTYDLLDRPIEERKEDLHGNCLQKNSFGYDAAGNQSYAISYVNGKESKESLEYDSFHRVIKKTDAYGFITSVFYETVVNQKTTIDPLGLQIIETYNADNKLLSSEKRSKNKDTLLFDSYTYDLNNNRISKESRFKDEIQTLLWEYDSMNRLKSFTEAAYSDEEKISFYSYTPKGLIEKTIKPSGVSLDITYNCLGDLITQTSSDGSINYSYKYNKTGKVLESTDENTGESIRRSYNARGQVLEETLPSELTFKNTYDLQGRRTELTLPDDSTVAYDFGPLHLNSVSRYKNKTLLYTHRYTCRDLSGHLLLEELPLNLGTVSHEYDLLGRSSVVESPYFSQNKMVFDAVGNLLQTTRMGERLSFTYDDLYQLSSEKEHEYLFDGYNNRLSKDSNRVTYNALNQSSEIDYNSDGNPNSLKNKKLIYDALNRLTSIKEETKTILYTYDSFHRRLSKKIYENEHLTQERYYLYDGQNEIGSVDECKNFIELRVLGSTPSAEIGSSIAIELQGELFIPFHDLHGNISALYSPSTGIYERYAYTAFGEERFSSPVSLNPWRFSSKRTDDETGLVYYGRRYYDPERGRWLTPDPLGLEAGPNMYAFLFNGPLTRLDLYGLEEEKAQSQGFFSSAGSFCRDFCEGIKEFFRDLFSSDSSITIKLDSNYSNTEVFMVGGITTTKEEIRARSLYTSAIANHPVNYVNNATHGGFCDVLECFILVGGITTPPAELIALAIRNFHDEHKDSPDAKMFWIVHSQGALHMYYALESLPKAIQNRCVVLAIAPARIVPTRLCHDSYNYASRRDFVPYCSFFGSVLKCIGEGEEATREEHKSWLEMNDYKELRILKPHDDAPKFDHGYDSKTYENKINEHLTKHIKTYGGK